jgi:hypothetical protein
MYRHNMKQKVKNRAAIWVAALLGEGGGLEGLEGCFGLWGGQRLGGGVIRRTTEE